jgi:glycogen operon protein
MHVDGFRFDLASILGRDDHGNLLSNPPLIERIGEDPLLRGTKLIAEAWDSAGDYQVGSFSRCDWVEWNGRYRDDVRRFWRGDTGVLGAFASRICGSADIYTKAAKGPHTSVNFVTCHDGFTLNDLVTYQRKHNGANGQDNQDGADENFSDNYGIEGETGDARIQSIRTRQIKNFLVTLMISRGIPMLSGGDEFRRTQGGNNNAYCQDNESSWYDWDYLKRHQDVHRFTRGMIAFRREHPVLSEGRFYTDSDISWFNARHQVPDWSDTTEKHVACLISEREGSAIFLIFNAANVEIPFQLPIPPNDTQWHLVVDTAREPPHDLASPGEEPFIDSSQLYTVTSRSSVILLARRAVQSD